MPSDAGAGSSPTLLTLCPHYQQLRRQCKLHLTGRLRFRQNRGQRPQFCDLFSTFRFFGNNRSRSARQCRRVRSQMSKELLARQATDIVDPDRLPAAIKQAGRGLRIVSRNASSGRTSLPDTVLDLLTSIARNVSSPYKTKSTSRPALVRQKCREQSPFLHAIQARRCWATKPSMQAPPISSGESIGLRTFRYREHVAARGETGRNQQLLPGYRGDASD